MTRGARAPSPAADACKAGAYLEVSKAVTIGFRPYITRDPSICGGGPVITGTRVTVRTVLACLAEGMDADELLRDYPTLTRDAVRAVVAFAALSPDEDLPPMAPPQVA